MTEVVTLTQSKGRISLDQMKADIRSYEYLINIVHAPLKAAILLYLSFIDITK